MKKLLKYLTFDYLACIIVIILMLCLDALFIKEVVNNYVHTVTVWTATFVYLFAVNFVFIALTCMSWPSNNERD